MNVPDATPFESSSSIAGGSARSRRALVVSGALFSAGLEEQLAAAGYEILCAAPRDATRAIKEFMPGVVLIAPDESDEGLTDAIALARRLRAQPETYALPFVFLYQRDERNLRSAALHIGADDYFPLSTPPAELRARLEALFWRTEAGRRNAPIVGEQRSEIDNFLILLDAVRADIERGATGTLALVSGTSGSRANLHGVAQERLLAEAHGFFKLYLRRIDAVAFYGPTILLVYMPRRDSDEAQLNFVRLREQFLETRPKSDLIIGHTSFPAAGSDVEKLIERAEVNLHKARLPGTTSRIVADGAQDPAPREAGPVGPLRADVVTASPAPLVEAANPDAHPGHTVEVPLREKRAVGEQSAAPPLPVQTGVSAGGVGGGDVGKSALSGAALEAGKKERERRASGVEMPRRLLLTVSDATRMAQLNLLIRSAGYEVRAAFDGQQALSLLRIERPDLLLVDFELQDMDAVQMLRQLRKQSGGRVKLPVVLLLAAEHESVRRDALEAGACDIIMLPCEPSELLDAVRAAGTAT